MRQLLGYLVSHVHINEEYADGRQKHTQNDDWDTLTEDKVCPLAAATRLMQSLNNIRLVCRVWTIILIFPCEYFGRMHPFFSFLGWSRG
jgi:hypothetical protein